MSIRVNLHNTYSEGTSWNPNSTETLTNKSIDADLNTITDLSNSAFKTGAAIARSKIASGSARHVVANDASGFLTSIAPSGLGSLLQSDGTDWSASGLTHLPTVAKTTTYTATLTDTVIYADTSGGAWTLSLPAANTATGKIYEIIKTDSSTNALTIDADGAETINGASTVSLDVQYNRIGIISDGTSWYKITFNAIDSMVTVHTGNGVGTNLNNKIRRFTTQSVNRGSDITYADSETLGATFTINTNGIYSMTYAESASQSGNLFYGMSLNSNQLTASIPNINAADRLSLSGHSVSQLKSAAWSGYLSAGDIIRPHLSVTSNATDGNPIASFTITKVGYV